MREHENARPGVAAPERAGTEKQAGKSFLSSRSNNTIIEQDKQVKIVDLLQHGEAAAIPGASLVTILGLRDDRVLRRMVDAEREGGVTILASDAGYFLPSLDHAEALAEARRFVARQDSRLRSNRRNVEAARRMLAALEIEASGQLSMEGETYAES